VKQFITLILLIAFYESGAQSQGPNAGSSSANTGLSGSTSTTSNGNNSFASDNSYASNTTDLAVNGNYSDYLAVSGFGFSIPSGSTITGIEVSIERNDVNNKVKDNIVSLIKGGTIGGTNKASNNGWPSTDATATYGSNIDLWGNTWTDSDINSSAFGVAFSWKRSGGGTSTAFARIDQITIIVYYSAPLPIQLLSFNAIPLNNSVQLSWTTVSEVNNFQFVVERSPDLEMVEEVVALPGAGNSSQEINYSAADVSPLTGISYYRLRQTDNDGQSSLSPWLKVNMKADDGLRIIPNPVFGNTLNIILPSHPATSCAVSVTDISGKRIYDKKITRDLAADFLSISGIPFASGGLYFLSVEIDGKVYRRKFSVE